MRTKDTSLASDFSVSIGQALTKRVTKVLQDAGFSVTNGGFTDGSTMSYLLVHTASPVTLQSVQDVVWSKLTGCYCSVEKVSGE